MANEVQNNNNSEIDEDNINIDDIEGLERDLPSEENNTESSNKNSEEVHELLPDGKLKTTTAAESLKSENEVNNSSVSKLNNKKFKITLLILIILITVIAVLLYFSMSQEDVVEEKQPVVTQTAPKELPPIETYEFKLEHINVSRLNKKLENLNKYELLGMTEEEYLLEEKKKALLKAQEEAQLKEKLRLEQEALEKEALEKARLEEELAQKAKELAQDEASKKAETPKTTTTDAAATPSESNTKVTEETIAQNNLQTPVITEGNEFIKFVLINTNQKAIYKSYLQKIKTVDSRINPCRNINNTIEIFVGPLMADENFISIIESIKNTKLSQDVTLIEVTKEEFSKRCMVSE